ncbi:uncharacterized protein B0H18DRAFT_106052 [Fomitopsis serialis]|uniref:uncharacterized protein n=1 Tax=Fomitopsis serialis TaxID=139415 RepID=UPI0020082AB1|nr:uncharacterized protein B0H18DRAFT_106052 [Neoantrodia serialis]KAH9915221.1 hypothetical protein B0H18DRAFT_106052 [Neoantrodia serialis]
MRMIARATCVLDIVYLVCKRTWSFSESYPERALCLRRTMVDAYIQQPPHRRILCLAMWDNSRPAISKAEANSDVMVENTSAPHSPVPDVPIPFPITPIQQQITPESDTAVITIIFAGFNETLLEPPTSFLEIVSVEPPFTLQNLLSSLIQSSIRSGSSARSGRLLTQYNNTPGSAEVIFIAASHHPLDVAEHSAEEYSSYQRGFHELGNLATAMDNPLSPVIESCGTDLDVQSSAQVLQYARIMNPTLGDNVPIFALYFYRDPMVHVAVPVPVHITTTTTTTPTTTPMTTHTQSNHHHPITTHANNTQSDSELLRQYIERTFVAETSNITSIRGHQEQLQVQGSTRRARTRKRGLPLNLWFFRFRSLKVIFAHFGIPLNSPVRTAETRVLGSAPQGVGSRVEGRAARVAYEDIYDWAGVEASTAANIRPLYLQLEAIYRANHPSVHADTYAVLPEVQKTVIKQAGAIIEGPFFSGVEEDLRDEQMPWLTMTRAACSAVLEAFHRTSGQFIGQDGAAAG